MRRLSAVVVAGLSFVLTTSGCQAAEIVFIHGLNEDSFTQKQLELTARFYGLDLQTFQVRTRSEAQKAVSLVEDNDTVAAVVSADAAPMLPPRAILAALRRPRAKSVPLLIVGITPQTVVEQFTSRPNAVPLSCDALPTGVSAGSYLAGHSNQVTRELADQEIPSGAVPACTFSTDARPGLEAVLSVRAGGSNRAVFVWDRSGSREVFFLASMSDKGQAASLLWHRTVKAFSSLAPMMMFTRYAAGERAWHSDSHYANLAIDDAWLTEPYGHLDYRALLGEMEAHNFHTTIAFIPWNFDRSEPGLVPLFRTHADRFSICIHGNNHDHLEFGSYDRIPLSDQIADIQQGLARMEQFRRLTGISFDRVMIFPDEVLPPLPTLRTLGKYDFLAAANADVVPLGSARPTDPLFYLRAVSSAFTAFPLVRRYSADPQGLKALIAINAFLENPLLFYSHQSLFANGISAFNAIAATINQVQPDVRWASLGCMAQHLYVLKLRSDGNYEVLAFSRDFILQNKTQQRLVYYIQKREEASTPIQRLTINGQPASYELAGGRLHLAVPLGAGESKHVIIEYQGGLDLASVDVSKTDLKVALLRRLSDFRDITLSRSAWGRAVTRFYYENRLDDLELGIEHALPVLLALAVFLIPVGWWLRRRARTRRLGVAETNRGGAL